MSGSRGMRSLPNGRSPPPSMSTPTRAASLAPPPNRRRRGRAVELSPAPELAPVGSVIGPLFHHAAIGQDAHAVLAARAVADFAPATALHAEYRRRIGQRPGAFGTDDQHGQENEPDRSPHVALPVQITISRLTPRQSISYSSSRTGGRA